MFKNRWQLWSLMAFASLGLAACNGGGGGGGGGGSYITQAWYNVYGYYCGGTLRPGCDFYANGDKVTYWDSPLYAPLEYGTWYYTDVFGYSQVYVGWGRQTSDGILYDDTGRALNSNEKHGRDSVTNAAAAEKAAINGAAQALSAKYGLDVNVARNIAGALNDWAVLGKSRKRTEADVAAFSKRLSGLDINEVTAAMEAAGKGDNSALDQAIDKAAQNWSTSPDTMKQILQDWFMHQSDNQE